MFLKNKKIITALIFYFLQLFIFSILLPLPSLVGGSHSQAEASGKQPLDNLQIGDRLVDNSFQWEFRTGGDYSYQEGDLTRPVIWIVVAKEHYGAGSGITLLSEELIGIYAFDNSTDRGDNRYGSNHWGNSGITNASRGLRPWLNSNGIHTGEGFYHAFSDSFRTAVITTAVPNRECASGNFYLTEDKVFVPSIIEIGDKRHDWAHKVGKVYPYFENSEDNDRIAQLGGENWNYWTRTPAGHDCMLFYIQSISGRPEPSLGAADRWFTAIRPALNLRSETSVSLTPNAEGIYEIIGGKVSGYSSNISPKDDSEKGIAEINQEKISDTPEGNIAKDLSKYEIEYIIVMAMIVIAVIIIYAAIKKQNRFE